VETTVGHWTKELAARMRVDDQKAAALAQQEQSHAGTIAAKSHEFWSEFLAALRSDAELFNAEFPEKPERHIAIHAHSEWGIEFTYQERGFRLNLQRAEIGVEKFMNKPGLAPVVKTPFKLVALGSDLRAGAKDLFTPSSLSQFFLSRLLGQ
jgi:hypothetical protein